MDVYELRCYCFSHHRSVFLASKGFSRSNTTNPCLVSLFLSHLATLLNITRYASFTQIKINFSLNLVRYSLYLCF